MNPLEKCAGRGKVAHQRCRDEEDRDIPKDALSGEKGVAVKVLVSDPEMNTAGRCSIQNHDGQEERRLGSREAGIKWESK